MRQRLYRETIPGLAHFWLKTIYASGYRRGDWRELNRLLKVALSEPLLVGPARGAVLEINSRIQNMVVPGEQTPESVAPASGPVRASLSAERVPAYIIRLLNEWLPVEVARLLIEENESMAYPDDGIPVLATGSALEHLLLREHLSEQALKMLLNAPSLSPEYVYPADLEVLQDVVLSQLGETRAGIPCVMPATLLCVAPNSNFPVDYRQAVHQAFLVQGAGGEEVHVPIAPALALEMMEDEPVRIGSVVVTMDGRSWEAKNLQGGEHETVVYRPAGRLRIDYSGDHARLRVPWPENRRSWSGSAYGGATFKIFGREWRADKWEVDGERTWLHLVFARVRPVSELIETADTWRLRPASVDIAWTALECALTNSLVQKSNSPIEQLRHPDLMPLGRALVKLTALVKSWRPQNDDAIENQLRALQGQEGPVVALYGRVPWRILPGSVRSRLLEFRDYPAMLRLLNEVFEGLPQEPGHQPLLWRRGA